MRLVIIGNGVAGVSTARFVVERDPSIEIAIYSDEDYAYYPRPRLIELVAGQVAPDKMALYADEWYTRRGIRVHLGQRVTRIEPDAHTLTLHDGSRVPYDQLVLATGASCVLPPIPGRDLEGVFTLRSMRDALALRTKLQTAKQAVVLGGGLLGLDTSMGLRAHNIGVTVIELMPRLLPRQLDAEGAGLLQKLIEAQGVQVVTGEGCTMIEGQEHVERIRLKSGRTIETDLVLMSAGVRANLELAQEAGLACKRGILVDEHVRTSAPDIYAVGDVAEFNQRLWAIIPAALAQARVAAAQITGATDVLYQDIVPSTTLKVTGIELSSMGEVNPEGGDFSEIRHMDAAAGVYKKLVVRDGHVVGAIVLGDKASIRAINHLIEQRTPIAASVSILANQAFDLVKLA
jgi:NAD(P)H-nitrite reductase large subunit